MGLMVSSAVSEMWDCICSFLAKGGGKKKKVTIKEFAWTIVVKC